MQFFTLPTAILLLTSILSVSGAPLPVPTINTNTVSVPSSLILDTRATPQFVPDSQLQNELETREQNGVEVRDPRFKVTTPGTQRPVAPAPKTGVVQSIKNGLKKLICNDNNCVAEPAVDSDDEGSFKVF